MSDTRQIYIIADQKRLVVQKFIKELENNEIEVIPLPMASSELKFLPSGSLNIAVCLSDDVDYQVLQGVKIRALHDGSHIYFLGTINSVSIKEEEILKTIPAFSFPKWPIETDLFLQALEWNNRAKKRILVVDDDPMLLRSIKTWLEAEFEVYMVNSGLMALDFILKHPVDLVLLDYEMPTMNGAEVLRRFRSHKESAKLPVMFLTSKDDRETVMSAIEQRANGYILKSRPPRDIINTINEFFKTYIIDIQKLQ
ncbi:MAG: response regulator transcription factor [Treponema sp.]|nr:response regulator transcription factor [Treponema sp.]